MKNFSISIIFLSAIFFAQSAFVDSTSGYAWSENTGWIDFSAVTVSTTTISGYAYSPNIGWISMNCSNTDSCSTVDYGITNARGVLSGYAWSENTGWIDFSQVSINIESGIFSGYAYSPNIGWISMNCSNTSSCSIVDYKVDTSWIQPASRTYGSSRVAVNMAPFSTLEVKAPTINPPKTIDFRFGKSISRKSPIPEIKELQKALNKFIKPEAFTLLVEDGKIGNKTILAIKKFQKENSLVPDGIVGPKTITIINKLLAD